MINQQKQLIIIIHHPPTVEHRIPYKQHYDPPKPRSHSRPRSASSQR